MKTELSVPRSHREIVEELLSQLTEEEEGEEQEEVDLGGQGYSQISDDSEGEISAANGELEDIRLMSCVPAAINYNDHQSQQIIRANWCW